MLLSPHMRQEKVARSVFSLPQLEFCHASPKSHKLRFLEGTASFMLFSLAKTPALPHVLLLENSTCSSFRPLFVFICLFGVFWFCIFFCFSGF